MDDMVNYVTNIWKVPATAEDVRQILDDPSESSFVSEIGGILTVNSMKTDMDNGEFSQAAYKGVEWLFPFGLKEAGFIWLYSYISIATTCYDLGVLFYKTVQEKAFNAQVSYYLWYRTKGESEDDIRNFDILGGWLWNPEREFATIRPASNSGFTVEDVLKTHNVQRRMGV